MPSIALMASHLNLIGACCVFLFVAANADAVFNIKTLGAVPDIKHDSTKALEQAWADACAAEGTSTIEIPVGDYMTGPVLFKGPCKGPVAIQLDGNLFADTNLDRYKKNWLDFQYINGLTITGKGKFDGQGPAAWPFNNCPKKWECKILPISLSFSFVTGMKMQGISSVDSKFFHMNIFASKDVDIRNIVITAPDESPNTDGIHMGGSSNIVIADSVIGTGDDCVSVGSGTSNVTVSGITCGPGHGISVGSLGKDSDKGDVTGLTVKNCTIIGTMNGIRIKTWQIKPNSPHKDVVMKVSDFTYEDIVMRNVSNPIIIDQEYCPYKSCPESEPSRVKISAVKIKNIKGTSNTADVIKLVCSNNHPCEGVELSDIDLEYTGINKALTATSTCKNVKAISSNVKPVLAS